MLPKGLVLYHSSRSEGCPDLKLKLQRHRRHSMRASVWVSAPKNYFPFATFVSLALQDK
jgi:hypothetical protein